MNYPITTLCKVMQVSTSGFYDWRKRAPSERAKRRACVEASVKQVHEQSHGIYGSRKIAEELAAAWLDELVSLNGLDRETSERQPGPDPYEAPEGAFPLAPRAQRILAEGVTDMQRNACFRLAVQLKKAGLPRDLAEVTLAGWAEKNRPVNGKRKITDAEIAAQVKWAYTRPYQSIGCEDPAVMPFHGPDCPCVPKVNTAADRQGTSPRNEYAPTFSNGDVECSNSESVNPTLSRGNGDTPHE
jgi:hypothetical protein